MSYYGYYVIHTEADGTLLAHSQVFDTEYDANLMSDQWASGEIETGAQANWISTGRWEILHDGEEPQTLMVWQGNAAMLDPQVPVAAAIIRREVI